MLQRLQKAVGWPIASPAYTRVNFQVTANLGHGETLFIVGDAGALGGSIDIIPKPQVNRSNTQQPSVTEGIALVTTPELYPVWYNPEPVELRLGTGIKYRYAICRGGRFFRYENLSQPRQLHAKGSEMSTNDELDVETAVVDDTNRQSSYIIPRLSSGQAFFDRKVLRGANDSSEGSVRRGQRRIYNGSGRNITASIPEEDEEMASRQSLTSVTSAQDDAEESNHTKIDENLSALLEINQMDDTDDDSAMDIGSQTHPPLMAQAKRGISPLLQSMGMGPSSDSDDPIARLKRPRSASEDRSHSVAIESTDGVIIVASYLPVFVKKVYESPESSYYSWKIEWDEDDLLCPSASKRLLQENMGMYASANKGITDATRLTWVGAIRSKDEIVKGDEDDITKALSEFHCVPVFLRQCKDAFHKYSSGTLWPVFHNIVDVYGELPTRWWNPNDQKDAWRSYTDANRIFVDKVIEVYHEGDLVWVHGVDLLLTPSFLSRRMPFVNVGLFLHAPFPSSEIFRTLSVREELLRGMLNADHIGTYLFDSDFLSYNIAGFHLYEYARHFLTSCRRILGVKYSGQPGGYVGVEYSGRTVAITISHIGISPQLIDTISETSDVQQQVRRTIYLFELTHAWHRLRSCDINTVQMARY